MAPLPGPQFFCLWNGMGSPSQNAIRWFSRPSRCPAYNSPRPPRPSTVLAHSRVAGSLGKLPFPASRLKYRVGALTGPALPLPEPSRGCPPEAPINRRLPRVCQLGDFRNRSAQPPEDFMSSGRSPMQAGQAALGGLHQLLGSGAGLLRSVWH